MKYCYVLKFQDHNLIKIGITNKLVNRVTFLEKDLGVEFDYMACHIFKGDSNSMRTLEKQLLYDTINDTVKEDHSFCLPAKCSTKYTEIRTSDSIDTVIKLQLEKIQKLNLPIKHYYGLDISGFKSKVIPQELVPYDMPVSDDLDIFLEQVKEIVAKEKKPGMVAYQEILYAGLLAKGIEFNLPDRKRNENCYYA